MRRQRTIATILLGPLAAAAGCQLISGLSHIEEGGGGAGGTSSSSSASSSSGTSASSSSSSSSAASSSSGGCGDTQSSPQNCGMCGHDCGGGGCVMGLCQPHALIDASTPAALAVDAEYIYWAITGTNNNGAPTGVIRRIALAGGATVDVVTGALPSDLATDATNVYWMDRRYTGTPGPGTYGTGVMHAPAGSTMVGGTTFFFVPNGGADLHLIDGTLYWDEDGVISSGKTDGSMRVDEGVDFGLMPNTRFAVDGVAVYWITDSSTTQPIMKRTLPLVASGGSAATVITETTAVHTLAADTNPGGYLYYTTPTAVRRALKAGGTQPGNNQIAPASNPKALLVDSKYVYFTELPNDCGVSGSLRYATLGGGPPTTLATLTGCTPLAQDAQALYFASGGFIYRLVKPW